MAHVEQLVGSYRAWASNGASRAPAWLHDLREVGIARFHDLGFPNMKQEAWRFTSVAPIAGGSFQLLFLASGDKQVVTHPRNLVVVEREARASIVETYASLAASGYWTNAVTEIVVGDGARVDYHRVQRESDRAYHVAATQSHQGRGSTLNLHFVAFGSALARHDLGAVLAGPGRTLILNGLYLLAGAPHADPHTT